jgi:hypothetical protein
MSKDKQSATLATGTKVTGPADVIKRLAGGGPVADKAPTKAQMLEEIARRNEGREDDAKIVPASEKNDDLAAALAADDEAQSGN